MTSPLLTKLINLTTQCDAFTATDGQAFARFRVGPGFYILPVRSHAFRDWFLYTSFTELHHHPTAHQFHAVLDHLEARAASDDRTIRLPVFRRVAARDADPTPNLLLDLADSYARFVEISPAGWQTTSGPGALFQTSRSTLPIPPPAPGPYPQRPLDILRSCCNLPSRAAWLRCLAWLLSALRPFGQYPFLILQGPPGSGKSFIARILRSLIDPSSAPFTPIPASVRDLLPLARHNWVLAFDHISSFSPQLTDALCRISSGLGLSLRETFGPASEPLQQYLRRPILLTVTSRFVCPPEIASRALIVTCPPLTAGPIPEDHLIGTVNDARDSILGALCTALSTALARMPAVSPTGRLAAAGAWAMAASPALDCTETEMQLAFDLPPTSHPIVEAVRTLFAERQRWTGTATELLDLLQPLIDPGPNPRGLSQRLSYASLTLADHGIELKFRRLPGGKRIIDLREDLCDANPGAHPECPSQNPDPSPQPQETEEVPVT